MSVRRGRWCVIVLALAGLTWVVASLARAKEVGFSGNWKVTVLIKGQEFTLWLIQVEEKDGKATGKVLAAGDPQFDGTSVAGVQIKDNALRLELGSKQGVFKVSAYALKGEKSPKTLLGTIGVRGKVDRVRLEKSDDKELDPKKVIQETAGRKALLAALEAEGTDAKMKALKEFLKKNGTSPLAFTAALNLLEMLADEGAKATDLQTTGEEAVKLALVYGPEIETQALTEVRDVLLKANDAGPAATHFAREVVSKLGTSASAAVRQAALKSLAKALNKAGQGEEAKTVSAEVAKLEPLLDQEFLKTAVPFKVESFAGRKGKSEQAVLVELFTGAQCPPCVAADVAFDGLVKTYKAKDVVLLQYHLHVPAPDALTNKASEERAAYYEIRGTPAMFINGQKGPQVGGPKDAAEEAYQDLRSDIDKALEEESKGQVKLTVSRKGTKVEITAAVSALKKPGKDVPLRFALVEESVRYVGSNGQRFHHHIVRAMPGGPEGVALTEKSGMYKESVDLAELRKSLDEYLDEAGKKRPFRDDQRPLALSHLAVVAFIQHNDGKQVVDAAQAAVPVKE